MEEGEKQLAKVNSFNYNSKTVRKNASMYETTLAKVFSKFNIPFTLSDDKHFQSLLSLTPPSAKKMCAVVIPNVGSEIKNKLRKDIGDSKFSLSFDETTHRKESFMTITIRYVNLENVLRTNMIQKLTISNSSDVCVVNQLLRKMDDVEEKEGGYLIATISIWIRQNGS
uniref:Zinc finger BED domain-containing protein 5 n=1 Tax=Rhabditophanes sp. KR3021 TaxID=114890 RepID=A0AC35UG43_9BILA